MFFDIIILFITFIFMLKGYNKGLVTTVLSLVLTFLSIFIAKIAADRFNFINIGFYTYPVQYIIFLMLFLFIGNKILKIFCFEKIIFVGHISKILGAILYFLMILFILLVITKLIFSFSKMFNLSILKDSIIFKWLLYILDLFNFL